MGKSTLTSFCIIRNTLEKAGIAVGAQPEWPLQMSPGALPRFIRLRTFRLMKCYEQSLVARSHGRDALDSTVIISVVIKMVMKTWIMDKLSNWYKGYNKSCYGTTSWQHILSYILLPFAFLLWIALGTFF